MTKQGARQEEQSIADSVEMEDHELEHVAGGVSAGHDPMEISAAELSSKVGNVARTPTTFDNPIISKTGGG